MGVDLGVFWPSVGLGAEGREGLGLGAGLAVGVADFAGAAAGSFFVSSGSVFGLTASASDAGGAAAGRAAAAAGGAAVPGAAALSTGGSAATLPRILIASTAAPFST